MERPFSIVSIFFVLAAVALSGCAGSGGPDNRAQAAAEEREQEDEFKPEKVSVPEYREFLAGLRESVSEGEPREFNEREMRKFDELHNELTSLLEGHESTDTMNPEQQREVFNTHEKLQALVSGRREDQVICNRRHTVGTNFKKTECYTRKEWREAKDDSQQYMRDRFRRLAVDPSEGAQ